MNNNNEEIIRQLKAPFPFEEVEAKIQVTSNDKTKGMAVFYLDARAVQERLDSVLGMFGWRNEYILWQGKSQICGLSIYNAERSEWITKYDGAENSDIEAIKGGLTDAFKRSAVLWGVGRYLYQIEGVWIEVEQRGKGSYIKDSQQGRLRSEYDKAVARIFGSTANRGTAPAPSVNAKPSAQAPVGNTPVGNNTNNTQQPVTGAASDYWVQSVKPSGKESQRLELINPNGDVVSAYIKTSDKAIKVGSMLKDVDITQKQSSYGQYNLINDYKIAA